MLSVSSVFQSPPYAAAFTVFGSEDRKTLTALFPRTISVYEGSDLSQIAALATAELDDTGPTPVAVGDRVVINPVNFGNFKSNSTTRGAASCTRSVY